jgi:hypothetical protein
MRHNVQRTLALLAALVRVLACQMTFLNPMNGCSRFWTVFMAQNRTTLSRKPKGRVLMCHRHIFTLYIDPAVSHFPRRAENAHPAVL